MERGSVSSRRDAFISYDAGYRASSVSHDETMLLGIKRRAEALARIERRAA